MSSFVLSSCQDCLDTAAPPVCAVLQSLAQDDGLDFNALETATGLHWNVSRLSLLEA